MTEKYRSVIVDILTMNLAWAIYYWFRVRSGLIAHSAEPDFIAPMIVICVFWIAVFWMLGLYDSWYVKSRVDELITILKAVILGVLILFFAIFIDDQGMGAPTHTRLFIAGYGGLMITCVGAGRLVLHSMKRRLLEAGIGMQEAVIVGLNEQALNLYEMIRSYPALGYRVVGFLPMERRNQKSPYKHAPVLGGVHDLPTIIDQRKIKQVLIALDSKEHDKLLRVIASCNGHDVSMKIIPDLYDIVSGQARTNQIYGFPLIEVTPLLMPPWEQAAKRLIDILVSFSVLFIGFPVWLLIGLAIKIDSKGPVFYAQERVGKEGEIFRIIKFRSMNKDAELESGPVWAHRKDPRATQVGKLLRRLRLDEIPQFINVLRGDMSLVGPRPERPFFVEKLSKEFLLYARRLKVRPGITGWAQVKHKYDESLEDVKTKVKYDLFYIENMSLRMDLKILLNTIYVVLTGRGH